MVSSLAALLSQPVQEAVGQALSSVWMSVSLWGALSAVTPTPPYWPCPCLSLALPRMPPFNPMNWWQPARPETTPQIDKQFSHGGMGEGKANSRILSTYCVSGWPWVSHFVHVITFLSHSSSLMRQLLYIHFTEEKVETQLGRGRTQAQAGLTRACVSLLLPTCLLHML